MTNGNEVCAFATAELPLVLTVAEAGCLLRISRGAAYEAVRRGDIPSIRIGRRRLLVPTQGLLEMLGIAPSAEASRE